MDVKKIHYCSVFSAAAIVIPALSLYAPLLVAPLAAAAIIAAILIDMQGKTPVAQYNWPFLILFLGQFGWSAVSLICSS